MKEATISALVQEIVIAWRVMRSFEAQGLLGKQAPKADEDGSGEVAVEVVLLPLPPWCITPDYGQATQNFKRCMPSFELSKQSFEQFMLDFQLLADQARFVLPTNDHPQYQDLCAKRDNCLKESLYQCLSAEA